MPVITALRVANRRGSRTLIELDGAAWAEVETEVVLRFALRKEEELDPGRCDAILAENAYCGARRAAVILLKTRPRAVAELRRRLAEKRFAPAIVERAMDHFAEIGDLDDARFARQYARQQLKVRGAGPRKVRDALRRLGVAETAISEALAEAPEAQRENQENSVRRFLEKRLRHARRGDIAVLRRKLQAALLRAGFEPDVFRFVLPEALSEHEEGDSVFSSHRRVLVPNSGDAPATGFVQE